MKQNHFMKIYLKKEIIKSDVFMTQFKKINRFPKLSDTESRSIGGPFNQAWNSKLKKKWNMTDSWSWCVHIGIFKSLFSGQI